MSLAVREPTPDRGADTRGDVRIERVHVQADMDEAGASDMRKRLAHCPLHPEPVDVAHREHLRVELAEQRALALVQRADADEGDPAGAECGKAPAGLLEPLAR